MGWYSTAQAIKGIGSVKESLNYESDKFRTLSVAISQIEAEIKAGTYKPDIRAKLRIAYWSKRTR